MEEQILRLIYDYSINGLSVADPKFINKLVEIVVNERKLENYVTGIEFSSLTKDEETVVCAGYMPFQKKIVIDFKAIFYTLECQNGKVASFNSLLEQNMFMNLVITQYILHELEHALQTKKADDKINNLLEVKLIRISFKLEQAIKNPKFLEYFSTIEDKIKLLIYLENYKKLYREFYRFNPTERMAEIYSYKTLIGSLELIKKQIIALYSYENSLLLKKLTAGYSEASETMFDMKSNLWKASICPTQTYLYGTGQGEKWTGFDFYDDDTKKLIENVQREYTLSKRLALGLPITSLEQNRLEGYYISISS